MSWPWPRDTREDRLKRIAESYRTALMEVDPGTCRLLDVRMIECGQGWICRDTIVDTNRMVTAQEVSEEFGIPPWTVHDWARRHPELIPKHKKNGRALFRLGDLLRYQALHKKKNQYS